MLQINTKLLEEYKQLTAIGFIPKTIINIQSATTTQIEQLEEELKTFREEIPLKYLELWTVANDYGLNASMTDTSKIRELFYNKLNEKKAVMKRISS